MVRKHVVVFAVITCATIALDQALKYLVSVFMPAYSWGIFSISLLTNSGAGFGIFQGKAIWLALVSLLVALATLFYYPKIPAETIPQILAGLFLGGVVGNLIDRVAYGYVLDFIHVSIWPAFNIADAAITVAVAGIIWYSWKKR